MPGTLRAQPDSIQPRGVVDHQRLFESAADAVLVTDAEGAYIGANPRACELTGYTMEELLHMRVGDLCDPADRDHSQERFKVLQQTGRTRATRRLRRKDGTVLDVEAHATAVGNGTYQTTLRDISDRVAAEKALRQSVDAYSTLVSLCHAAVISAGADGRIMSWNPAAEALFGYSAKEAAGMPIIRLMPQDLRDAHVERFERHVGHLSAHTFSRTVTTRGLRKDGSEVVLEISVAVGWHDNEQVFTAVVHDVSAQQQMVEELNDALQLLRFHVQRMPLAYVVWDRDFRAVEWNPAAERIFGYTRSEVIDKHAYNLIVPSDVVETVAKVWNDLLHGDTSSHSVNANVRKDGSRLTCEWFNTPLRDSRGQIHGVASMAMDVSEREAMEAQLRNAQKLESLGVLASGVAHDFNSSLMVILGNTSLLRSMSDLPSKAIDYIELIENAGLRAGEFIRHLLAYARTGRHNPQPTELNEVVRDASSFLGSALGPRHPPVLTLGERLPTIFADRGQIEQIILNLCLNAKQAMPDGGRIHVATRLAALTAARAARCVPYPPAPGRYVEVIVADSGCGMNEVTVQRIFDPFFTTKTEGHGLGLAAVLGILRAHGAVAFVDTGLERGTKFHVYFQIHKERLRRAPRSAKPPR